MMNGKNLQWLDDNFNQAFGRFVVTMLALKKRDRLALFDAADALLNSIEHPEDDAELNADERALVEAFRRIYGTSGRTTRVAVVEGPLRTGPAALQ